MVQNNPKRYLVETEGEGENPLETDEAGLQAPGCFSSEECRSKFGQFFGTGHNAGESSVSQQFSSICILNNIVHL